MFNGTLCIASILGKISETQVRIGVSWLLLNDFLVNLRRLHYLLLLLQKITKVEPCGEIQGLNTLVVGFNCEKLLAVFKCLFKINSSFSNFTNLQK